MTLTELRFTLLVVEDSTQTLPNQSSKKAIGGPYMVWFGSVTFVRLCFSSVARNATEPTSWYASANIPYRHPTDMSVARARSSGNTVKNRNKRNLTTKQLIHSAEHPNVYDVLVRAWNTNKVFTVYYYYASIHRFMRLCFVYDLSFVLHQTH